MESNDGKIGAKQQKISKKMAESLAHVRKMAGSVKVPEHLKGLSDNELRDMAIREHFAKKYAGF